MELVTKLCKRCNKSYEIDAFLKNNKLLKTCMNCRLALNTYKKTHLCEHEKQPNNCRKCYELLGVEYLLDWTIKKIVYNSRKSDIFFYRYDQENYIDYDFVRELVLNFPSCCYCDIVLTYNDFSPDMCSIERIDNTKCHSKDNVKISCLSCNIHRVGSLP